MATNEIQNGCESSIEAVLASNHKRRCVKSAPLCFRSKSWHSYSLWLSARRKSEPRSSGTALRSNQYRCRRHSLPGSIKRYIHNVCKIRSHRVPLAPGRQTFRPELVQLELFVELTGQPAPTPLAGVAHF